MSLACGSPCKSPHGRGAFARSRLSVLHGLTRVLLRVDLNTAGLSLSTVVAAPEAASQEAMRVAPVAKGLPVTSRPASGDMIYKVTDRDPCPMLYIGVMLITDAISK